MIEPYWTSKDGRFVIYCGDCLDILPALPKVDAVITDPPYKKEFNYLYGRMAQESKRILKDGGLLFTLSGHHSLAQILSDMTQYLDFYWIGGMPNKLGSIARYHPRQIMMGWKPCIWLSNGKPQKHDYVFDFMQSKSIERVNHEWEQSQGWFEYYIEKITKEGDIIIDPFMGSGTTGVACARLGRKFIGIEISKEYCDIAVERIKRELSQPRLELESKPNFEQTDLF